MSRTLFTAVIVAVVISSAVSTAVSFAAFEIRGGGDQGAQGPQGLQGSVGPEGPQGSRGPAGATQFVSDGEDFALCADNAVLTFLVRRVLPASNRNVAPSQTEIADWIRLYELDVDECG